MIHFSVETRSRESVDADKMKPVRKIRRVTDNGSILTHYIESHYGKYYVHAGWGDNCIWTHEILLLSKHT